MTIYLARFMPSVSDFYFIGQAVCCQKPGRLNPSDKYTGIYGQVDSEEVVNWGFENRGKWNFWQKETPL